MRRLEVGDGVEFGERGESVAHVLSIRAPLVDAERGNRHMLTTSKWDLVWVTCHMKVGLGVGDVSP